MTQLITIYCLMFFVIECLKNMRRAQRILARTYVGDLDDKLAQASWMMICVGLILSFSSSLIFLPCILFVKMGASMFMDYFNHRNDIRQDLRVMSHAQQLMYPKLHMISNNNVKLLPNGGNHASNSRH